MLLLDFKAKELFYTLMCEFACEHSISVLDKSVKIDYTLWYRVSYNLVNCLQ